MSDENLINAIRGLDPRRRAEVERLVRSLRS
jgi:hypothetical protein